MNALRQLLGNLSPEEMGTPEVQNALAQLLQQDQMPQPRFDIAPMQANTMRAENGPEAGKVTSLDFRGQQPQQPMRMAQMGTDGVYSDAGQQSAPMQKDLSRPIEIAGKGKGYWSKDGGSAIIDGPNGPTRVLMGVDRNASYLATKRDFEQRKGEQDMQAGEINMQRDQAAIEAARAATEHTRETTRALREKPTEKPLTEFQGKSLGYGQRAANAHEILNGVGQDGKVQPGLIKRGLEAIPVVGDSLGTLANFTQSDDQKRVEQAQRDFVNAVLRQESGAAISAGEFDNAKKQYFPQPGDSPGVIEQKKRNREIAISGFAESAGPAKSKVLGAGERARAIFDAKKAIAQGAPRDAVRQRLQQYGVADSEL